MDLKIENRKVKSVIVDMGIAKFEPENIPVFIDKDISKTTGLSEMKLQALDKEYIFSFVSVGNPNAVTVINDIDNIEIYKYGPILENDRHFAKRANIEFVKFINENEISIRTWERGVGETLACATGAVAAFAVLNKKGLINNSVKVNLLGGILDIKIKEENNHIFISGPAETVFEGTLLENIKI